MPVVPVVPVMPEMPRVTGPCGPRAPSACSHLTGRPIDASSDDAWRRVAQHRRRGAIDRWRHTALGPQADRMRPLAGARAADRGSGDIPNPQRRSVGFRISICHRRLPRPRALKYDHVSVAPAAPLSYLGWSDQADAGAPGCERAWSGNADRQGDPNDECDRGQGTRRHPESLWDAARPGRNERKQAHQDQRQAN